MDRPLRIVAVAVFLALTMLTYCCGETGKFLTSNKSFLRVETTESDEPIHRRTKRSTNFASVDITAIVDLHNEYRSGVSPEAANMEYMVGQTVVKMQWLVQVTMETYALYH